MRRVPGPDAAFLSAETPTWHMHVCGLFVLDPRDDPDFTVERVRASLAQRVRHAPQLRWRVVDSPLKLDRPWFVDDPQFNPADHIHRIAVPSPGGTRELCELVGDLAGYKLDRNRPLWEFWLIEGLERGRIALFTKAHHAIVDGVSGADLASILFDLEPHPDDDDSLPPPAEGPTSLLERAVRAGLELAVLPLRTARYAAQTIEQAFAGARVLTHDTPAMPFSAPRTSFNATLGPHRGFAQASVPLDAVRAVKTAFDVKLNDVVLALAGGALRGYLLDRDELPDRPLIAQVPVSLRTEQSRAELGTIVGSMFASLATDLDDPAERLLAIHESTMSAKALYADLAAHKHVRLSDTLPPAMFGIFARMWTAAGVDRHVPPPFNLIVSNVAGPPFDLYCAGATVEAIYLMGPLLASGGVNMTVMSYSHDVNFGVLTCRDLVTDPSTIADGIPIELDALLHAAKARTRRAPAAKRPRPSATAPAD